MAQISLRQVHYDYTPEDPGAPSLAVAGVDLDIEQGEFVAIIGHNGSGKSTLAKMINGLFLPTQGTVTVAGYDTADPQHLWTVRQKAGMVFQNPDNQLVSSIVEEDVAFGPENLGIPSKQIRERVDEALELVNMSSHKRSAPHLLSGGQKQRIAIAGILAMRPEILIMDEPTAMLDPIGREEVMQAVERLNREQGITVVLITHFMEEAARAQRIVVMDDGCVKMQGTPAEIFMQADELKQLGLDAPAMVLLSNELRAMGVALPQGIMDVEGMVDVLCQL